MNISHKFPYARSLQLRSSAQKMRLVADVIRGKKVISALQELSNIFKKSAKLIKKVLDSAIANAEHNYGFDVKNLKIFRIFIDEGPTMKRMFPRAKGRADRILKRTSHVTILLSTISHVGEL